MASVNSVDKIVERYFATVTRVPFTYKKVTHKPKPLQVSPLLKRGYTCPADCGGCCSRFSLDYLPSGEAKPKGLTEKLVQFNGRSVRLLSDPQSDHEDHYCRHLDKSNGRCKIHGKHPFTCDFELIRTLTFLESAPNVLTAKLYGRGWNMLRIDGKRGARCEMTPATAETIVDVIRKLGRLREWTTHFGLSDNDTWIPEVVTLLEYHPNFAEPVTFSDGTEASDGRIPLF